MRFDTALPDSRRAARTVLAAALLAYVALNHLIVFELFPRGTLGVLMQISAGLINATLLGNALLLIGVMWLVACRIGGLSAADLGLRGRDVPAAICVLVATWLLANAAQLIAGWVMQQPFAWNARWLAPPPLRLPGELVGQLFGNALFEELLFRGLLFHQLLLRLRDGGRSRLQSLVIALLVSQAVFALAHVPLLMASGADAAQLPAQLAPLFVLGALLALLYARTGNLLVVVAVHAVSNAPTSLVAERIDLARPGTIAAVASLVLIAMWPRPLRPRR